MCLASPTLIRSSYALTIPTGAGPSDRLSASHRATGGHDILRRLGFGGRCRCSWVAGQERCYDASRAGKLYQRQAFFLTIAPLLPHGLGSSSIRSPSIQAIRRLPTDLPPTLPPRLLSISSLWLHLSGWIDREQSLVWLWRWELNWIPRTCSTSIHLQQSIPRLLGIWYLALHSSIYSVSYHTTETISSTHPSIHHEKIAFTSEPTPTPFEYRGNTWSARAWHRYILYLNRHGILIAIGFHAAASRSGMVQPKGPAGPSLILLQPLPNLWPQQLQLQGPEHATAPATTPQTCPVSRLLHLEARSDLISHLEPHCRSRCELPH